MLDNDKITLLWNEYENQNEWQRHNENQRAQLVNILLVISAALVTLPAKFSRTDWAIPAFLIGVGAFGFFAMMKYWERFTYHVQLEIAYRKALDSYFAPNG